MESGRPTRAPASSSLVFSAAILMFWTTVTTIISGSKALDAGDYVALQQIAANLQDIPNESATPFFDSWKFADGVDPCTTFAGVQCVNNRVAILNLGNPVANSPGLTGTLSPAIGQLTFLQQLSVVPGQVYGTIPDSVSNLANLQFLGLSSNKFRGPLPSGIGSLAYLQNLILQGNSLSGDISGIGYLPALSIASLAGNRFSGPIPSFTSTNLRRLDLQKNSFTGSLPAALPSTLQFLSLSNNRVSGNIDSVTSLTALNYLDVSFNQFTGSIPGTLFSLPLTSLQLQRNLFSGELLQVPGTVVIPVVDLSYNLLLGAVPAGFAGVRNLYLNNNRMSGVVPAQFGGQLVAGQIETLYLQHNYFTAIQSLGSDVALPSSVTLCFQYNCVSPPTQSLCPAKTGRQLQRPGYQCVNVPTGDGD